MDAHRGNIAIETASKLGIVTAIMRDEQKSKLRGKARYEVVEKSADTWFGELARLLFTDTPKESVSDLPGSVRFISFNYDRCIEWYLENSLGVYYDLDDDDARSLAGKFIVRHPYGSVASLQPRGAGTGLPFGIELENTAPWQLVGNIRTFSERIEDEAFILKMHSDLIWADQIVFQGFAFHRQKHGASAN